MMRWLLAGDIVTGDPSAIALRERGAKKTVKAALAVRPLPNPRDWNGRDRRADRCTSSCGGELSVTAATQLASYTRLV